MARLAAVVPSALSVCCTQQEPASSGNFAPLWQNHSIESRGKVHVGESPHGELVLNSAGP